MKDDSKALQRYQQHINILIVYACVVSVCLFASLVFNIALWNEAKADSLSKKLEVIYIDATHDNGTFIGLNDGYGEIWHMYMPYKPDMGEPEEIRVTYNLEEDCYYWEGYPMYIIDPAFLTGDEADDELPMEGDELTMDDVTEEKIYPSGEVDDLRIKKD